MRPVRRHQVPTRDITHANPAPPAAPAAAATPAATNRAARGPAGASVQDPASTPGPHASGLTNAAAIPQQSSPPAPSRHSASRPYPPSATVPRRNPAQTTATHPPAAPRNAAFTTPSRRGSVGGGAGSGRSEAMRSYAGTAAA